MIYYKRMAKNKATGFLGSLIGGFISNRRKKSPRGMGSGMGGFQYGASLKHKRK